MGIFERYLAEWLRLTDLALNDATITARRSAIEELAQSLSVDAISELAAAAHERGPINTPGIESLRQACQRSDSTFRMRANDLEIRVLAAATLVKLLESKGNASILAGLLVTSAEFMRLAPCVGELAEVARTALVAASMAVRAAGNPPSLASLQQARKALEAAAEDPSTLTTASLSQGTIAIANSAARSLTAHVNFAQRLVGSASEEADILWWVFGGYSQTLHREWSDVPKSARPIVTGNELAELTRFVPGPRAANQILAKALTIGSRRPGDVSLRDAVEATPKGWRTEFASESTSDALTRFLPVTTCIRLSLEVDNWDAAVGRRWHINPRGPVSAVALASQLYRERLIIKAAAQPK